ncbi:hypothetical protein C1H76_8170 [Elsinoe australis]|uniref:Uncharacterized protein n=1 Tax=Elsinoe australis TaxID=40998 RepID=A0A4U7ANB3_9PEZI|nr:hypothetical protein C1H76_8170 [Elsinoe australis]
MPTYSLWCQEETLLNYCYGPPGPAGSTSSLCSLMNKAVVKGDAADRSLLTRASTVLLLARLKQITSTLTSWSQRITHAAQILDELSDLAIMPRKLKVFEAKDFTLASAKADLGLPHSYLSLRWFAEYYGHTKVETQQARKITEEKLQEHGLCDDTAKPEELDEHRHLLASFLLESHASLFRNRWIGDPGKQEWFNATLETDGYSVHCGIQAWISVVSDNLQRKQKRQGNYVRRDQGSGSITQSIEESSPDPIAISGKESGTNNKPPQISRCGLSQLASRVQPPSGSRALRSISGVSACSPTSLHPPPSRLPSPSNTTSSARILTDEEIELQLYDVHKTSSWCFDFL